jgi:hypothetical protein
MEIKNAVITASSITAGDHSILSAWLTLDYQGSGQGFGGYCLYNPISDFKTHGNYAGHFIWRTMQIAGVEKWSSLVGKTIRVKGDWNKVHAIGHIIKEDWFNPSQDYKEQE